jgi:hypothetical protein
MSKQQIEPAARKTRVVLAEHVKDLVSHTLESSRYNAHGHAQGRQGRAGHTMPKTDLNLQSGARLP